MLYAAHLAAGLIVGKITGQYLVAILVSFLIDIDHIVIYCKHNILFKSKEVWHAMTSRQNRYEKQRNFLHSILAWAVISAIVFYLWQSIWIALSAAYLFHLILDLFDKNTFYLLYPIKYTTKGLIGYNSKTEWFFTILLFVVWAVMVV